MMNTATAAKLFLVISNGVVPTVSTLPAFIDAPIKPLHREGTAAYNAPQTTSLTSIRSDEYQLVDVVRQTSETEKVIGEIRHLAALGENWDGEGASAPLSSSIFDCVAFVRLITESALVPQPMLHASGKVSLFWNENDIYADVEFLGQNRVAYFIKNKEDKHKGVISFDSEKMPAVFSALIKI